MSEIQVEAKKVLKIEAKAILSSCDKIDDNFDKAVNMILNSKGRIVVTGIGKSGIIGQKIAATLSSTGTPAIFLHSADASHGDLGIVTKDDIILAISYSGETEEIINLIPCFERFEIKTIALTGNPGSTLAKHSAAVIDVNVKKEACPFNLAPTASTTVALAIGDALAISLLKKRNFNKEDFIFVHPGGSIGKRHTIRVKDLMHTDPLPVVTVDEPMTTTVVVMSSKRLGVTIVTNSNGKVAGIITDGDLRRGIEAIGVKIFEATAKEVMTKNPKTISENELAVKALAIMEKHSITSLLVKNKENKPYGLIHLHDILKKGIV